MVEWYLGMVVSVVYLICLDQYVVVWWDIYDVDVVVLVLRILIGKV